MNKTAARFADYTRLVFVDARDDLTHAVRIIIVADLYDDPDPTGSSPGERALLRIWAKLRPGGADRRAGDADGVREALNRVPSSIENVT